MYIVFLFHAARLSIIILILALFSFVLRVHLHLEIGILFRSQPFEKPKKNPDWIITFKNPHRLDSPPLHLLVQMLF